MPTYEEALASDPTAFVDCASAMREAGTDLTEYQRDYNTRVAEINDGWQDRANAAFNEDVAVVNAHVSGVILGTGAASDRLDAGGSKMASLVDSLKQLDSHYRDAGFVVHPEPRVEMGFLLKARNVAASVLNPLAYPQGQMMADNATRNLMMILAEITAADLATEVSLTQHIVGLQPLEDKGERIGDEEPDREENGKDREGERDTDRPSGSGDDSGGDGDGSGGSDDDEKDEDREEDEDRDERPEDRSPESPEPEEERPEPETPDFPNSVPPSPPDYEAGPAELTTPDLPDYESPWDPAELTGDEELSGGLAGGGGLGGGIGGGIGGGGGSLTADLPSSPGGGGAGISGLIGAPSGGASPTTTAPTGGARPGPGGMVGAPGSRGAVDPDDGVERESFLVEDPEEDVWGIGTDEDSPYADYRAPREEEEPAAPAPPVDELPPFLIPGFDPPGTDRT